ncbi:MAG: aminopeptidase P family protein [Propionibacteriaceae bacterium]|nr:aminopeptidase P family protein [Propionibacteriaceae bacterium]
MSDQQLPSVNRQISYSDAFKAFICEDWAPYPSRLPEALPASAYAGARREALSAQFPGERLVIPAGGLRVRNNDCDFRFRPHSAFAHLTGLGTDREPGAVLVLDPTWDGGHKATLYFHPRVPRTDPEFYASSRYGEMWVGQRESLDEMSALCGITCASVESLPSVLQATRVPTRVLRDADPDVTALVDQARGGCPEGADQALQVACSELRRIKDAFEVAQLREACDRTASAFADVVRNLATAERAGRGERWVEGVFGLHARHVGNAVGYDTIAAAGDHANTLHWICNDGPIRSGELLLLDAGIELDSLYTADITRTLPINGRFSDAQRQVYDAVRAAQQAGIDAAKPGAMFSAPHDAAVAVLTQAFADWGILPVSVDQALSPDGGQWRRWMVHHTSHMLGLDVHDCAHALREHYKDGPLEEGMVLTVEPGIYFKSTDLHVPPELRGIGVRIEDDIVITATGCDILSSALPRESADVEAWMAPLL